MALSSRVIPYLVLLGLIVSCVPGFYWGFKRLRRYRKKRHNQQDGDTPFVNRQQSLSAILLEDDPHHSSILPRHHPTNNGRHRVSSATPSAPSYPGPVPVPEYRAVWLSAVFVSSHTERPGRLYTDQSYQHNATWFEHPHELDTSAGMNTIDHP
ncbi:hypothetical protein F5883DRAFT_539538 [Diaporthe sp. PMI_573]|nr:hypothetical protein F5883DRAFT_539538 [Diaporthaceae sp. PMI_573]